MVDVSESLLQKVASKLGEPASFTGPDDAALLAKTGAGYSPSLADEAAKGFDGDGAAVFEALVEAAFLVANADGVFDDLERDAFQQVVVSACGGAVRERQIEALLEDLSELLAEDGIDKRARMVAKTISRRDHALEVLRIGGLIAYVSEGVSDVERAVLDKLAGGFGLEPGAVDDVLAEVEGALCE